MDPAARSRLRRAAGWSLAVAAGVLAVAFLVQPRCPILHFTGLYCPGCGGRRMLLALLRGDPAAAFRYNPFLFVLAPVLAAYLAVELVRYVRALRPLIDRAPVRLALLAIALLAIAFMALRNLPGLEWLRP